jgi:UDP-GlcNAc:undecaprenyl-phosphate GlcNAc-1-phosphate transferase
MEVFLKIGVYFFTSLGLSFALTRLMIVAAQRFNWMYKPRPDRWCQREVALFGGFPIIVAFATTFFLMRSFPLEGYPLNSVRGILYGALVIFIGGFLDDIFDFKPLAKLFFQSVAIAIPIYYGFQFELFQNQPILGSVVFFGWIILVTNAFNLLDGADGVAAGVGISTLLSISFLNTLSGSYGLLQLLIPLLGAILGFWFFNMPNAKIFMGDCGSQFLGFLIASVGIIGTWKDGSNIAVSLLPIILIIAIPIFDVIYVSIIRGIEGRRLFKGATDHSFYAILKTYGLSPHRTMWLFTLVSFVIGMTASVVHFFTYNLLWPLFGYLVVLFLMFGLALHKKRLEEKKHARKPPNNSLPSPLYSIVPVVCDVIVELSSLYCVFVLLTPILPPSITNNIFYGQWALIVVCTKLAAKLIFRVYELYWMKFGLFDATRVCASSVVVLFISFIEITLILGPPPLVVFIVLLFDMILSTNAILVYRFSFKVFDGYLLSKSKTLVPVVLVAQENEEDFLISYVHNLGSQYQPIAILKFGLGKHYLKRMHNLPVFYEMEKLDQFVARHTKTYVHPKFLITQQKHPDSITSPNLPSEHIIFV